MQVKRISVFLYQICLSFVKPNQLRNNDLLDILFEEL